MNRRHPLPGISVRPLWTQGAIVVLVFSLSALLQIGIVREDLAKTGVAIAAWKPIVWETTSATALCLLIPAFYWLSRRLPFDRRHWSRWFAIHAGLTLPFSFAHVVLMGLMREIAYAFTDAEYDTLKLIFHEFLYEYRKDVFTYFVLLAFVYAIRDAFASSTRVQASGQPAKLRIATDRGDVLLASSDIETLEAAGNYVIVTTSSGVCECRASLSGLLEKVNGDVVRVHRSCAVGRDHIRAIRTNRSGDGELELASGRTTRFSRRYKAQLLAAVEKVQSASANATT